MFEKQKTNGFHKYQQYTSLKLVLHLLLWWLRWQILPDYKLGQALTFKTAECVSLSVYWLVRIYPFYMFRKILHNEIITISLFSKALKTGDLKCIKIFCPHWSSSDASILQPQHLLSGLPIFKDTWPQGGLCDRKTSPPCTRLLSRCEPSPCFASFIWWRFCAQLWPMNLVKSLMSCYFHFAQLWEDSPREDGEVLEKFSFRLTLGSNHLETMSVTREVNPITQNIYEWMVEGVEDGGAKQPLSEVREVPYSTPILVFYHSFYHFF